MNHPEDNNYRFNRFIQWLGRTTLKLLGWQIIGELPKLDKFILIGAPIPPTGILSCCWRLNSSLP